MYNYIIMNVLIFDEYHPSQQSGRAAKIYPEGIHGALKTIFEGNDDIQVKIATQDMPEHGLTEDALSDTDVLIYWGHVWQAEFMDSVAERVQKHVLRGMGVIFLHASKTSKVCKRLLGTSCSAIYREDGEKERVWTVSPAHPIASGIPGDFTIDEDEMYGEYCDLPKPDDIVFIGSFAGGEVMRAGCTFTRGFGKIFYFQPGHHTFPVYNNEWVRRVIYNATLWAAPAQKNTTDYVSTPVKNSEGGLVRRIFKWK